MYRIIVFIYILFLLCGYCYSDCVTNTDIIKEQIKSEIVSYSINGTSNSTSKAFDVFSYVNNVGSKYKIGWDSVPNAEGYDLVIYSYDRNEIVEQYQLIGNNTTTKTITLPYASLYIFAVRAWNKYGCSVWALSVNKKLAKVRMEDGNWTSKGWWIITHMTKPKLLSINK